MDQYNLTKEISSNKNYILSKIFSLFQRSLQQECSSFIKQIEADAKRLKKGEVILITVLKEDNKHGEHNFRVYNVKIE